MKLNLFQIIFSFLLLLTTVQQIRALKTQPLLKRIYGLRWILISFVALLVITHPGISQNVANIFGISRGVDFVTYTILLWLLYMNHQLNNKLIAQNEKIVKLVRKLALQNVQEDKN